jgi:Carboxypeptidase regulatory-like domain
MKAIRLGIRFRVVVLLLVSASAIARAQINMASLTGQVQDASGAAAAGVNVTARNLATNVEQVVTADGAGAYHFVSLPAGT